MSKSYRPYDPDQQLLLPAALREWLPDDHLAYFISDVVDQLDLSEITARYERESRGGPPYHPRMMVKVLLYGYCVRGGVLPANRPAAARGHSVPGTGSEQYAGFPYHLGLPQGQSGYAVGPVPAGIGVVPAGGSGEAGSRCVGRHQGEGERIEAQGDAVG